MTQDADKCSHVYCLTHCWLTQPATNSSICITKQFLQHIPSCPCHTFYPLHHPLPLCPCSSSCPCFCLGAG